MNGILWGRNQDGIVFSEQSLWEASPGFILHGTLNWDKIFTQ